LEHFGDVGSLDDNVESFLSNDDGDARDIFAALKPDHNPTTKGTHLTFLFICVVCVPKTPFLGAFNRNDYSFSLVRVHI
jgi:hypothetical protein